MYISLLRKYTQQNSRHNVSTNSFIDQFASLVCLTNGEFDDIHQLSFATGSHDPKQNILNHKQAMEASDHE